MKQFIHVLIQLWEILYVVQLMVADVVILINIFNLELLMSFQILFRKIQTLMATCVIF